MNLTINDFKNFQGSGQIVISREQGYRNPEIEEASFLHKVKSFFGFSSAKAKNQETVDALRNAIRNDPSLYLASHEADRLLGQVKGAITAEKVRNIRSTLEMKLNEGEETYKKMARDTISGQIAAHPPMFLQDKGLHKNQQFMAWYCNAAASLMVDKPRNSQGDRIPDSWKQVGNELTEFNRFFERCLSTFKNNKSQINAFISMCSGKQHMLGTGYDVCADFEKTLQKVHNLKHQFDKVDSLGEDQGRDTKLVLLSNVIDTPNVFSEDMLEKAVEERSTIQMTHLRSLKPTASKEDIATALRLVLDPSADAADKILSQVSSDSGAVDQKKTRRQVQKLAIQCAVASFDKKEQEEIFRVLNGFGGQALKADLMKNPNRDLIFMYNAILEALNITTDIKLD